MVLKLMEESLKNSEKLHVLSLLICNDFIEDKRSGTKTFVGVFNKIYVQQLPAAQHRMFVVASLTGSKGECPIEFRIFSPIGSEVMCVSGRVILEDSATEGDFVLELIGLPLNEEGSYTLVLHSGNDKLASRHFSVEVLQEGGDLPHASQRTSFSNSQS